MFAYAPPGPGGTGFAIATDRFVALLSTEADAALAGELYHCLDDAGSSITNGLAVLSGSGAGVRFALVEVVDRTTRSVRVAVRGDLVVDLGSAAMSRFTWPNGATWIAGEARGVESLRLALTSMAVASSHLPLARGVAPAAEAVAFLGSEAPTTVADAAPAPAATVAPAAAPPSAPPAHQSTVPIMPPGPLPVAPASVEPASAPPTVVTPEAVALEAAVSAPTHEPTPDLGETVADDEWGPWASEVAAPTHAPEGAAGAPYRVDRKPQRLDLSSLAGESGWTLRLPDGKELDAAPQIVVGRRPWRSDPDETSTYYIVAPSPRREISGKHVEFAVVGNELLARDMGSTNGTLVITPDKPPRLLHEGHAVNLDIGDTLDLGEGFKIIVGARK